MRFNFTVVVPIVHIYVSRGSFFIEKIFLSGTTPLPPIAADKFVCYLIWVHGMCGFRTHLTSWLSVENHWTQFVVWITYYVNVFADHNKTVGFWSFWLWAMRKWENIRVLRRFRGRMNYVWMGSWKLLSVWMLARKEKIEAHKWNRFTGWHSWQVLSCSTTLRRYYY